HQRQLRPYIMYRQEMSTHSLLRRNMVHKCPCNSQSALSISAADTSTAILNRSEIIRISCMPQVQDSIPRNCISKPCSPRWPHTIKHICSKGNADNQVLWIPNSHHISRLVDR